MPQMKLTKTKIDRVAKPRLFASDVLYWDTEIKGFGLRVTPTGKTTFIKQGRANGIGAAERVTVCSYGCVHGRGQGFISPLGKVGTGSKAATVTYCGHVRLVRPLR